MRRTAILSTIGLVSVIVQLTVGCTSPAPGRVAVPPRDTARAATPTTPTTPAPSPNDSGSFRMGQLPRGSTVMVDGRQMRTNPLRLPAGNHEVLVTLSGYDTFRQRITITKDQELTLNPELRQLGSRPNPPRPSSANCSEPGATYNVNNACWDTRARPSDATPPAVPISRIPTLESAGPRWRR